jgi:hypothetical protein
MSVDYPAEGDDGSARNKQSQRDQHSPIYPQSTQDVVMILSSRSKDVIFLTSFRHYCSTLVNAQETTVSAIAPVNQVLISALKA